MYKLFTRLSVLVVIVYTFGLCIGVSAQEEVYKDAEAKFSIKLLPGWKNSARERKPDSILVGFTNMQVQDLRRISITRSVMLDKEGLLEYFVISYLRDMKRTTANFKNTQIENKDLNGLKCIFTTAEYGIKTVDYIKTGEETINPVKSTLYFLRKGSYFFVIRSASSIENFKKVNPEFEKIISTFQIIE